MRVVLERLGDRPFDLAQGERLGDGSLGQWLGQRLDHEVVSLLGELEGAGFAAGADDSAGGPGEANQVLGLATAGAGGQLGGEAG